MHGISIDITHMQRDKVLNIATATVNISTPMATMYGIKPHLH